MRCNAAHAVITRCSSSIRESFIRILKDVYLKDVAEILACCQLGQAIVEGGAVAADHRPALDILHHHQQLAAHGIICTMSTTPVMPCNFTFWAFRYCFWTHSLSIGGQLLCTSGSPIYHSEPEAGETSAHKL